MAKGLKIWKTIMLVSLLCLLLALGGGMLACNPGESHTHSWSETYSYDDNSHWLSCSGCDQRTGTEAHVFDNDQDTTCNVCDYTRHVHTLVWKNDGDVNGKHWQEYSCEHHSDERLNEGDHVWGNDNICDVCLFDRTPEHVHHQIVRYDETEHWTTYDCTEHGNEKINPQPHTFTNGDKCDGCDYVRGVEHQHSLSGWVYGDGDPQYHWKEYTCWHHADEQLEKTPHNFNGDDTCDDCGYERAHDHNNYLIWNFNDTQHWQTATCHPADAGEKNRGSHSFNGGVCECGLDKRYVDVYNIYKAYEQAKGESDIDEFTAWYTSLKTQNVDHVGVNATGDAVFYSSKEDTTGTVMYYGERTVVVNTSGILDVWVAVKVTVSGQEPKVLDIKESTADGVTLKFIPLWKDNATYTVSIATEEELIAIGEPPIPIPANHIITDEKKSFDILPFENKNITNIEFSIVKALGLGLAGSISGVILEGPMAVGTYREFSFANSGDWEEGLYKLDVASSKTIRVAALYFSLTLSDGGLMQGDNFTSAGNTKAFYVFNFTSENTSFYLRWSGSEDIDLTMTLTHIKQSDLKITNNKLSEVIVNQPESEEKVSYDISGLEAGKYILSYVGAGSNISFSIDGSENAVLSNSPVVNIADGASLLTLTQTKWNKDVFQQKVLINNISICFTKLNTYTTDAEYKVNSEHGFIQPDTNHDLGHYFVAWTPAAGGAYTITLSADTEFTNVTVKLKKLQTGSSNTIMTETGSATTSHSVSFIAEGSVEYYLDITTDNKNNSQYPTELTLKIEKADASAFEVNTATTVEFGAENTQAAYVGQLNKGAYLLYLTGDNLDNVSIQVDINGRKTTVNSSKRFETLIVSDDTSAMVNAVFSGSDSYPTAKFVIIDMNDGTDIASTMKSFTAKLNADKFFQTFYFTEDEANYYLMTLESLKDLKNIYVYCATHEPNKAATVVQWLGAADEEAKKREFFTPDSTFSHTVKDAKYVIAFIADKGDTDYPEDINISLQKSLYSSGFYQISEYVPYVSIYKDGLNHATSYELYLAMLDSAGTPSAGQYQHVKTFTGDDSSTVLEYLETDQSKMGKYFYWKIVLKDDTGTYLQFETTAVKSPYNQGVKYNNDGLITKVTVTFPDDFEGVITLNIYDTASYTDVSHWFGQGTATVTKGETQKVIEVYSPNIANKNMYGYIRMEVTESDKYTLPSAKQVKFGDQNFQLSFTNKIAITATVNLPDNFVAKDGESLKVVIYRGQSTNVAEGVAAIDEGGKTATVLLYVDKGFSYTATIKSGVLAEGYEMSAERYNVVIAEGEKTGTVTLTVKQRTKVDVELTLPAHFTGGQVTVKFYLITNGTASSTSTVNKTLTLDANDTDNTLKQTITVYLPMNNHYKIEFVGPSNSGYFADDIEDLELNETTVKAEMTVLDRVAITANVELPGESTATSVTVNLCDKTTGQVFSSGTAEVSDDESSGKKKGSVVLYGPEGHEFVLRAEDTSVYTSRSDYDTDVAEVTLEGKTGSGTIEGYLKYSVKVNIGFASADDASKWVSNLGKVLSQKVYLYQGNTQLMSVSSGNLIGDDESKHWEVTFYLSNKKFESGKDYYVAVAYSEIYTATNSWNFIFPSVKVDWSGEQKQTTLEAKIYNRQVTGNLKNVEIIIKVPEGYTNRSSHTIRVMEVYGVWDKAPGTFNSSGDKYLSVSFSTIADQQVKATYTQYPEGKNLYFNLTGGTLSDIMDPSLFKNTNAITKEWYAVPGEVTYDEDGKGHVEIQIKKATPIKLTMPELGLDDGDAPEFTVNIELKDKYGNPAGKYTYTVNANAKAESVNKNLYVFGEEINGYTAEVSITESGTLGCAYSLSETKAWEFKDNGGVNELQINLVKNTRIKVTVPNLDNSVTTPLFDITLKIKDGDSLVGSYTLNVPKDATADGYSRYIFVPEWKDGYTMEVSSSTTNNAYKLEGATHELLETEHNIKINVTKKPIAKVTLSGIVEGTDISAFTIKITVQDASGNNVSVETSLQVPAKSADGALLGYIYLDSWAEGYKASYSGTCTEYIIKSVGFGADDDNLHTLTVNLAEKAKISIVTDGLVGNEVHTQAFKFNIIVRNSKGETILTSNNISVDKDATDESFVPLVRYLDSLWEEGFNIEYQLADNNKNDYDISHCEFSEGEGGIHKLTVHFTEQTRVKVKIPGLVKDLSSAFTLTIKVKDSLGDDQGSISVAVPAKSGPIEEYITHFKTFDGLEEGVQFSVTANATVGNYTLKSCSYDNSGDMYTVTVEVEAKLSVKIVVNGLDADLKAVAFTLRCTITNANVYYDAKIPEGASAYEYVWVPTGIYGGWQERYGASVRVTGSTPAASVPYTFSAKFEEEVINSQHVMTVTATPKEHIKVIINGLDGTNELFSLNVNIVKSDGSSNIFSKSLSIAAQSSEFEKLYFTDKAWEEGSKLKEESQSSNVPYKIAESSLTLENGKAYLHVLTITLAKREKLTVSVNFPPEFASSAAQRFMFDVTDSSGEKKAISNALVTVTQGSSEVDSKVFYMDDKLEAGSKIVFTYGGTVEGYTIATDLNVEDGTLTITVTAAAAAAA